MTTGAKTKLQRKAKAAAKLAKQQERRASRSKYKAKKWEQEHGTPPRPRSEIPEESSQ